MLNSSWFKILSAPHHSVFLLILLLGLFVYYRTKKIKVKRKKKKQDGLQVGDSVVTSSGIIGKIRLNAEHVIDLEIAENVVVKIDKSFIAELTEIEI
jgi:preprotein translocase subunit YajC